MNFFKKVAAYSASDRNITKYVSVKIWFFNDPIHKEEPVLDKARVDVIIKIRKFLTGKRTCKAIEVSETAEVNEAA